MKIAIIIFLTFFFNGAFACLSPAPGFNLSHDELIENTEAIYLATPVSKEHAFKFKVIEVLKGSKVSEFEWSGLRTKHEHISNDFDAHENSRFWIEGDKKVIRSPYNGNSCKFKFQFTFVYGESYLIFKESPAHPHSAEIIKNSNDKWYQYVRAKISHNKSLKHQSLRSLDSF